MVTMTACPPPDQLHAFASGTLPSADSEAVFAHLQDCPQCQSELETISDQEDSLIASLRQDANANGWQQEPGCQRAVAESLAVWATATADGSLTADALPPSIGEYEILRPLGRGGMGQVFLAQHTKLGRRVAVKVLASHRLADRRSRERFDAEMRAIGRLSHPNIVTAHDAREVDGRAVLVTEYIDGLDLGQVLERTGALSIPDACEIVRRVAVALEYTHQQGFIHRDVKPSNVMLSSTGEVKLLDLGLARLQADLAGEHAEITATGQAMGTADYVAPEQVTDSRSVDIRADIYALGCTLYKLLTGRAPFADQQHETPFAKMTAHVSTPPPRLSQVAAGVPAVLENLLLSMLAKDPAQRPQTPQQVAASLSRFATGSDLPTLIARAQAASPTPQAPAAAPSHTPAPPVGWMRRPVQRWAVVATGLAALLLGVVLGAMGVLIKIRYPDGTVAEVRAPAGSQVAVEYEAEDITAPSQSLDAPLDMRPPARDPMEPDMRTPAIAPNAPLDMTGEASSDMHDLFSGDHGNANAFSARSPQGTLELAIVKTSDMLPEQAIAEAQGALQAWASNNSIGGARDGGPLPTPWGAWTPLAADADPQWEPVIQVKGHRFVLLGTRRQQRLSWQELLQGVQSVSEVGQSVAEKSLELSFNDAVGQRMKSITANHQGQRLAMVVDGVVIFAPAIHATVGSKVQISGLKNEEQLRKLHGTIRDHILQRYEPAGVWLLPSPDADESGSGAQLLALSESHYFVYDKKAETVRTDRYYIQTHMVPNEIVLDNFFDDQRAYGMIRRLDDGSTRLAIAPTRLAAQRPSELDVTKRANLVTLERVCSWPPTRDELKRLRSEKPQLHDRLGPLLPAAAAQPNADLNGVQAKAAKIIHQSSITAGDAEGDAVDSKNRLKQIGLAFHNFHDVYKRFPGSQNHTPVPGDGGTVPPYSWRVAILPFVGHADLYQQYRFDEPWDSEHNRQLLDKMPEVYRSPFAAEGQPETHTNFLGFATEDGALGTGNGTSLRDIMDGTSNTVLVVEGSKSVPWTKPEDYSEANVENLAPAVVEQGGQPLHMVLVDGSVRTLDMANATHRKRLQQAITRAGNERIIGW